ncbi:hypothetical protein SAMN04515648_4169 [Phyllobacterium sp. CL33Tsu]|nr:hypothetical protein SAMN04515648_4169 [Phyllobacterium sp. CL33Tsu]
MFSLGIFFALTTFLMVSLLDQVLRQTSGDLAESRVARWYRSDGDEARHGETI